MKITIDIDCTPEEARTFLGLPDLAPLHAAVTEEMTRRTREAMADFDAESVVRQWVAGGVAGMEQLRKYFFGGGEGPGTGAGPGSGSGSGPGGGRGGPSGG